MKCPFMKTVNKKKYFDEEVLNECIKTACFAYSCNMEKNELRSKTEGYIVNDIINERCKRLSGGH